MGKTTIVKEKNVAYEGVFDIKSSYSFLKGFLEDFKHYDVTEKEVEEKNKGGSREIKSNIEAELEYNDYYKFIITMELKFSGTPVVIETKDGPKNLVQGKANLFINGYLDNDNLGKRPKGPLAEFLDKVYSKYVDNEEKEAKKQLSMDVSEFISRFKQTLNFSAK